MRAKYNLYIKNRESKWKIYFLLSRMGATYELSYFFYLPVVLTNLKKGM